MTIYYHPENRPLKFWKIERVGPGESRIVRDEIIDKGIWGFYRSLLEAEGLEIGGAVTTTAGWYKPATREWVDPETGQVTKPVMVRRLVSPETPVIHFGSLLPTFSMGFIGLILDFGKK